MKKHFAALLLAVCSVAGTASADETDRVLAQLNGAVGIGTGTHTDPTNDAIAGPDFVGTSARSTERSLAASDARDAIDPVDVIAFRFDSSKLDAGDKIEVREAGRWLLAHPHYRLVVEAHTDAYGGDAYNVGLAARRARVVRDELGKLGIARDRVIMAIYGHAKPPCKYPYAPANRVVVMYATTLSPASIAHRTLPIGSAVLW
jgi:outer membrane protein OmpA-like peptidoglycan-associated protein